MIEPHTTGRGQSWGWSAGYAVFAVLAAVASWVAVRQPLRSGAPALAAAATGEGEKVADAPAPTFKVQMLWLALAALGSVLLMAVTNHVTQNVASVPFLWALLLAIYLITFILCFDGKGWSGRRGLWCWRG